MTLPSDKELERLRLGPAQLAAHEAPLAPRTLMDRVMTALRQEESGAAVEASPMAIPGRATTFGVSIRLRTVALAGMAGAALILIVATRSTAPIREEKAPDKTDRVGEIERRESVQQASRVAPPGEIERRESVQQASRVAPPGEPKEKAHRIVWALFRDATGLVDNTRVQIAGRRVGAIVRRELAPEYPNRVKITIQIDDKSAAIWEDAIVVKKRASTSAEFYLEIDPGHSETFDSKGKKIEHRRLLDGAQIRVRDEAPPARDTSLPDQLMPSDIQRTMAGVRSRVENCHAQFDVHGMVNVIFTIEPSGRVSSAQVSSDFSDTPTGNCIALAVKNASFPPFKGPAMTGIEYPFLLVK